jgi:hypothetical protein
MKCRTPASYCIENRQLSGICAFSAGVGRSNEKPAASQPAIARQRCFSEIREALECDLCEQDEGEEERA